MKTKTSQAAYRTLEILKSLAEKPLSSQELLEHVEKATDKNFRKEMVLKYINTIKLLGIDIKKEGNKYYLDKSLECIDFSKKDLSIFAFIQKYINKINHDDYKNNIIESLQIIEKNFSEKTISLYKGNKIRAYLPNKPLSIKDENIKQYERYCKDELKVKIVYQCENSQKQKEFLLAPLKIVYKKGIAILIGYDSKNNEYKEFLVENILYAEQTPQKFIQSSSGSVLFKLKNRLAKSYVLKNNEILLESGSDFIIVSNKKEDKDQLLRRLLRYFDQCEILYPKSYRTSLLEMIDAMEKNYE